MRSSGPSSTPRPGTAYLVACLMTNTYGHVEPEPLGHLSAERAHGLADHRPRPQRMAVPRLRAVHRDTRFTSVNHQIMTAKKFPGVPNKYVVTRCGEITSSTIVTLSAPS